ncbi:phosphate acetyltransferase [Desulfotalea psychrophila]|uniref:Phosphate acetyltransferase n=1 Tax=Desulfotalea psychrophila (strain LSv54 / DSM 12343) TaxID=177439 RepID=Q6AQT6_DESPS|nr:phosphate acetyltransferase [Desulfotalea psychrophila]CAG35287.1 probable phosphate acetyltransferase [Desulfotalea psychrophila LSv54]
MTQNLYITATEERSGKSVIVLGVMQMLMKEVRNVAFFRPIISDTEPGDDDPDINLVLDYFDLDIPYEDTYGCTLSKAYELINSGKEDQLHDLILKKYKKLEADHDFILCEGTDFRGSDTSFEAEINADIAANLGAPLLLVLSGRKKIEKEIMQATQLSIDTMLEKGSSFAACIINRAAETITPETFHKLQAKNRALSRIPFYVMPENSNLASPSVMDVKKWLDASVMHGSEKLAGLVENYVVAAMQIGNFLDHIKPGSCVITPGDRSDIILASLASKASSTYPDISGIVLTGDMKPAESVQKLIEGWQGTPTPILSVATNTYQTIMRLNELYSHIQASDSQRIATALGTFSKHVDTKELTEHLISSIPTTITPKMFEYALMEKASQDKQRIVLPEGTCERILRAADILLRRGVANLTLLGPADEVKSRAAACGMDTRWVEIIDPQNTNLLAPFVDEYMKARAHKGMIEDIARDRMTDPTYFGTMMVHTGYADGMVSGAENTTAHTIRPAFEFIKTKPGISTVSSVFLMCLSDRVLVYGDCAVNPNPTAKQLAEIALSSAETARLFGIEPRVAMLSYSTGSSGKGEDVERVIEATKIAQALIIERKLDINLEGPIQYDAAIDPDVARTKLPNSLVAGKATVFTFPDLNTGNNTYKAVQRAAGAVAIGPILQGLNKPVNDLSRGCTVDDIVNTVAITAIQAQEEKRLFALKK